MTYVFNSAKIDDVVWGDAMQDRRICLAATTGPGTLATSFAAGMSIDGVVLALNDRILIKNQVTESENGIYVVQVAAPRRSDDLPPGVSASGIVCRISDGIVNGSKQFYCINVIGSGVVDTDDLVFAMDGDVTMDEVQTLTNKTLSTGSVWNGDIITVPYGGTGVSTLTGVVIGNGTSPFTAKTNPTGAFVGTTDTQVLTNKTLSTGSVWNGGVIAVQYGGTGAATLTGVIIGNGTSAFTVKTNPTGAFVGTTDTQTLTNKSLSTTTTFIVDATTASKRIAFSTVNNTASVTLTLASAQTTNNTLNFPNITATDTIATLGLAQTFSAVKTFTLSPVISSLSPSQAVVTNGSSALASLEYTASPTVSTISSRNTSGNSAFNNIGNGYTTTATSGSTTALTVASGHYQFFTGTSTQTVTLPVTNTIAVGYSYNIKNSSTQNITINASDGSLVHTLVSGDNCVVVCINSSITTNAAWSPFVNGIATQLATTGAPVIVSASAPPAVGYVLAATSPTTATWQPAAATGITTLNTLTASTQTFAVGTSGTDFNISSSTSTHTFNIPSASASNRGLVTTGAQTFAGAKSFDTQVAITATTNQLVLGTTNLTSLNFPAPASSITLAFPDTADTIVGRITTDTLTNKTLTSNTNNVIARELWAGSGSSSVSLYAATAPITGQAIVATSSTTATWQTLTGLTVLAYVSTTNATPTTIVTISTSASTAYFVNATIMGKTSTAANMISVKLQATYSNVGGVLSQLGSDSKLVSSLSEGSEWDSYSFISGTDIIIVVVGALATNIDWVCGWSSVTL